MRKFRRCFQRLSPTPGRQPPIQFRVSLVWFSSKISALNHGPNCVNSLNFCQTGPRKTLKYINMRTCPTACASKARAESVRCAESLRRLPGFRSHAGIVSWGRVSRHQQCALLDGYASSIKAVSSPDIRTGRAARTVTKRRRIHMTSDSELQLCRCSSLLAQRWPSVPAEALEEPRVARSE
jgi:hypothetical protein